MTDVLYPWSSQYWASVAPKTTPSPAPARSTDPGVPTYAFTTAHVDPWAPRGVHVPKLQIITCGGKQITLELGPNIPSVQELKARIQKMTSIPAKYQRLYLGNRVLDEGAFAGLKDGTKLLVVQEVHGG